MTIKRRVILTDKPSRINTANIVQRLRKLRTVVALILGEIDDGLEAIEAERKQGDKDGQEKTPG